MRPANMLWGLLLVALAVLWMLYTLNAMPPVMVDLIGRGWPAVLVALGLALLIGRRTRAGNWLALGLTVALVGGVVLVAYSREGSVEREDYREPIAFILDPGVTSLRVTVDVLATRLEIAPSTGRSITGEFVGSAESLVTPLLTVDNGVATLELREVPRNAIPLLGRAGRGRLALNLPPDVVIESLTLNGREGDLTMDASTLRLRQLSTILGAGEVAVQFSAEPGLIGDVKTGAGGITVTIPAQLAAEVALAGGGADNAQFSADRFTLRIDKVLVPKAAPNAQVTLRLDAPGQIVIR